MEKQLENVLLEHAWSKVPNWECLFTLQKKKRLYFSAYVKDIKLVGKKQNVDPLWKVLNKEIYLVEPTVFLLIWGNQHHSLIMFTLVALKNNVKHAKTLWTKTDPCPNPEFPQMQWNNYHARKPPNISTWSYDMESHAKKNVERTCELACELLNNFLKLSTPCIDDHQFKKEELKSVGELSNACSEIVLECVYLARIGRLEIQKSVNKLARPIIKWTKTCDKRLTRLISYIHFTSEYKQCCHVGNTAQQCRSGLFQDSDLAGDLEDSKPSSCGTLCIFGSHTFVPTSWMCKKETCVSHSSSESEIISAGLRMDGIPALDLSDIQANTERPVVQQSIR